MGVYILWGLRKRINYTECQIVVSYVKNKHYEKKISIMEKKGDKGFVEGGSVTILNWDCLPL